jgi:hypothetical protein
MIVCPLLPLAITKQMFNATSVFLTQVILYFQIFDTDHIASCHEPVSHSPRHLTERKKETSILHVLCEINLV